MKKLEKGQVVTLISLGEKGVITIWNDVVLTDGPKITRFVGNHSNHCTNALLPTDEELVKSIAIGFAGMRIAPDEAFIQNYIALVKAHKKEALAETLADLEKDPESRRFKSHLKLHIDPVTVVDRREEEKSA